VKSLVVILLVALVGSAHAEDKKLAEKHFKLGAKAYAAQNFEAAATAFDEAFKNYEMPDIAYSAAQAYRRVYQIDPKPEYVKRAIELYEFYLGKVKTGGRVGDAADNLGDMKRELAKLEAAGIKTTGTIEAPVARTRMGVNVSVPDQASADINNALMELGDTNLESSIKGLKATIDGKPVDAYALVEVDPKEHVIAVSADGYFPVEKKAQAIENQSIYVDVELRPKPAKVNVKTESGARVSVDGRYVATTPTAPIELTAGKHLVMVLRNGRESFGRELTLARGQELVLAADLRKTSKRRAVPWVWGAAGLFAVGAVATAVAANNRDNRAGDLRAQITMMGNQDPDVADELDRTVSSRDRLITWTWVFGGAAVVAGGVGSFLFFFDRPDGDSGTVGIRGTF
jgi:hypothetical protein